MGWIISPILCSEKFFGYAAILNLKTMQTQCNIFSCPP